MAKPQINTKDFKIARKVGLRKMVRSFSSYFDKLCPPCKALVLRKPKDAFTIMKRCGKCRTLVKDIEKELGVWG